jgi:hypothetical protein
MTDDLKQPQPNDLLELMRKRELREAQEFEERQESKRAEKESHDRRVETRKAGDTFYWTELFKAQSRCDHRKGTSGAGPKSKVVDYMVSRHTFVNGVTPIKCLKCKHRAFPGDTKALCHGSMDAYIANTKAKKGPQLPNPTKLSYSDWYTMTLEENTTNKPSRAEMLMPAAEPVTQ